MNVKKFLELHNGMSGCWVWDGVINKKDGYGQTNVGGKTARAHRIAYFIANGEIPEGLCVLHHCDNRPCCNPSHLFLGTRKDNYNDARKKGRWNACGRRGSTNPYAKLTEEQALSIFNDEREYADIAQSYGVSKATVCMIKTGQKWKHLHNKQRHELGRRKPNRSSL